MDGGSNCCCSQDSLDMTSYIKCLQIFLFYQNCTCMESLAGFVMKTGTLNSIKGPRCSDTL